VRVRRTKPLIAAFALSVLVALAALLGLDLWWRHERAVAAAQTRAANLSVALAEYLRSTFALADAALRQLEVHSPRAGGPRGPSQEWLPILQAAEIALPGRGSLSVTDQDGIVTHSTLEAIVGQPRGNHYLFQSLAKHDTGETVIDQPFASPINKGQFILPVGRRLEGPGGAFAGIVVAVMLPDAFQSVFETIDVGREGVVEVFHRSGIVMFREPSPTDPIGQQASTHPLVLAARDDSEGRVRGPLEPGGRPYISAFRTVPEAPLIVAVSLSENDVLADWHLQLRTAAAGYTAFAATLFGLMALLFRQIDARRQAEQEVSRVQAIEAARLRDANDRLAAALDGERQAREAVEAASHLKDEFLMTLSHELRTPLNAILGWVRMLAVGALPKDQRQRALETIARNARTQTRLVEDLLDVSRAVTGRLQLQTAPVAIADVIRGAVESLRPAIAARGLQFTTMVQEGLPPVVADADRLQQVVWNLLSNAIKFTPRGGSIRLSAAPSPGGVEIVVADTGRGIAAEFLPYVFDRFRQADASTRRETSGLGLGLAIAKHLVELHGGTLTASSPGEGQGASFQLHLPSDGTGLPRSGPVSA
jgi:signal transduction histidine kinase